MEINDIIEKYRYGAPILDVDVVYYYRDMQTFIEKILKKEGLDIWAGHVDYMRDKMEFQKGMEIVRSIPNIDQAYPKQIELGIKNKYPFQLSLSLAYDSYPMWQSYGDKGSSVMLILDYKAIRSKYPNIGACIYEGSEEYNLLKDFFLSGKCLDNRYPKNSQIEYMMMYFPYLAKDYHYAYEQEVRIFRERQEHDGHLNYKMVGNSLRPFKSLIFSKETLKGIMISPCSEETFVMNKRTLEMALIEKGYDKFPLDSPISKGCIFPSDILVRE